jgi:hypothetical protein
VLVEAVIPALVVAIVGAGLVVVDVDVGANRAGSLTSVAIHAKLLLSARKTVEPTTYPSSSRGIRHEPPGVLSAGIRPW